RLSVVTRQRVGPDGLAHHGERVAIHVQREIAADLLPARSAISTLEQHLRAHVPRLGIVVRHEEWRIPVPAIAAASSSRLRGRFAAAFRFRCGSAATTSAATSAPTTGTRCRALACAGTYALALHRLDVHPRDVAVLRRLQNHVRVCWIEVRMKSIAA